MKKIISMLLCLVMLLSTVMSVSALTPNQTYFNTVWDEIVVGDANGDGSVDMKDSLAMRQYCAGAEPVSEKAADINCDGKVNAKDLLLIKRCNAELEDIGTYNSDKAVARFTIAGNDITEYSIVYDENAKYIENMYFSADSLRKYINIATDNNLKVAPQPTEESKHNIFFVDVIKVEGMEEKLGIESYEYEVRDGDVYIYVRVRSHELFERRGTDLYCKIPISLVDASLGAKMQVPTLEGKVEYDLPEGTQTGSTFRFRGKGVARIGTKNKGDLYVTVEVEIPRNLSKKQKDLLKEFEKTLDEKNFEKKNSFLDKLGKLFK
jgi:hypothetical protein